MAKFAFKLEPVLNIKSQMEDNLKNELGKAMHKLEYEKDVLRSIENDRDKYIGQFHNESSQGILVEKLKEYTVYISHLGDRIEKQKENINYAMKNVDNYREQLIKVVQERKILERLREKKYQDFLIEQNKEEQRITDEVVSYKHTNKPEEEKNG